MNIFKKFFNLINRKKTKMEQEILEQPDIIFELIRKYINKDYTINIQIPENIKQISLIASGSSYNSAAITAEFIRTKLKLSAQAYYSSELILKDYFEVNNETLFIFISQSGETLDTNLALDKIKNITSNTLSITNVKNSKLWNGTNYKILTHAGTEKAIASTKAMSSQLFCLFLTAIKVAEQNQIPCINYVDSLLNIPDVMKNIITKRNLIQKYAYILANHEHAVILSNGMCYPLAKEGALKITETSYINSSAFPMGEFLHGHIAILNKKCAVIMLVQNQNISITIDVLMQINKKYKSDILIISSLNVNDVNSNDVIQTDTKNDIDFVFSSLIVFQLLAYETAYLLNRNIDYPEGLIKVVK